MSEIMPDQVPGGKTLGLTKGGREELFGSQSKCYSSDRHNWFNGLSNNVIWLCYFADIAIGAPFAGEDRRGRVFIYNGNRNGLNPNPSQILTGIWASQSMPAGFGFTLRGESDIDENDYPGNVLPPEGDFFPWKMHYSQPVLFGEQR